MRVFYRAPVLSDGRDVFLSALIPNADRCYLVEVAEPWREGAAITEGDILIIDEQAAPGDGDCLLIRGLEFMRVVRMRVQLGRARFLSMSNGVEIDLDLDAVEFCGVVVGQYRRL